MPVKKFQDPFPTQHLKPSVGGSEIPLKKTRNGENLLTTTSKRSSRKSLPAPNPATKELALSGSTLPIPTVTTSIVASTGQNGTLPQKYNKTFFKDKWGNITGRVLNWLDGIDEATGTPRLELLLAKSSLKEAAIFAGIGTEKVLLLEGQPTQIIGQAQQVKLDELGQQLQEALKKRGLITLTERKVDIKLDASPRVVKSPKEN